jgi:hypothetical protein
VLERASVLSAAPAAMLDESQVADIMYALLGSESV